MGNATLSVEERIARLEARAAELERAAAPAAPAGERPEPEFIRQARARMKPPTQAAIDFFDRVTQGRKPIGAAALRQMQIDKGADPDGTWCREEVERMREERPRTVTE